MSWTHEFHESGNGFPEVESDVVTTNEYGDPKIVKITKMSRIFTSQHNPNMVYLECVDSELGWDDLDEKAQDLIYEAAYHVTPIDEEPQ
jgi:hypothetical protein